MSLDYSLSDIDALIQQGIDYDMIHFQGGNNVPVSHLREDMSYTSPKLIKNSVTLLDLP